MNKKIPKITTSEKEILEVLWDQQDPLTSSEIVDVSENRTWKASSVHLLLNSLLKKGFVQVAGFKKTTKNYARTFEPSMTREEYSIRQIRQEQKDASYTLSRLFAALLEEEEDVDLLDELSLQIAERKKQLESK
ncbi:MAG: BlaI/MecI/CopY family transcriptional regulator [Eubacterium sp.]|nr:BlaI/MecI/CopY family transcriptional regulator [Eubacterium sp.]MDD7210389.1 BlaI/MecI/CopY family transcriptional regulator [Lachnospiraceae bacterium]MDY5496943.1 BlaI/MecI/CopY family transcriptional regulator [Anaerobutyricum sp.]